MSPGAHRGGDEREVLRVGIPAFGNSCLPELRHAEPVLTMQPNHPWFFGRSPFLSFPGLPSGVAEPSCALPVPYVASSRSPYASCLPSAQGGAALCPGWAGSVPAVDPLAPAVSWSPPPGTSQIAACGSPDAEVMALEPGARLASPGVGRPGRLLSPAAPSSLPGHPGPPRGRQAL